MNFKDFINEHGIRAQDDYELTCKRWVEEHAKVKKQIKNSIKPKINTPYYKELDVLYKLNQLRTSYKKELLNAIFELRKILLKNFDESQLKLLTRKNVLEALKKDKSHPVSSLMSSTDIEDSKASKNTHKINNISRGGILTSRRLGRTDGVGLKTIDKVQNQINSKQKRVYNNCLIVSSGNAKGKVKLIKSINTKIPKGTIGVFKYPTPKFGTTFAKCEGCIFLNGGITSHGSIIAREYRIPAVVCRDFVGKEEEVVSIKNGTIKLQNNE